MDKKQTVTIEELVEINNAIDNIYDMHAFHIWYSNKSYTYAADNIIEYTETLHELNKILERTKFQNLFDDDGNIVIDRYENHKHLLIVTVVLIKSYLVKLTNLNKLIDEISKSSLKEENSRGV